MRIKMEIETVCRSQVNSHTHEDYSQAVEKNNTQMTVFSCQCEICDTSHEILGTTKRTYA